jgi:hypothetical protein
MQNVMTECGDKREKMTSENHLSMISKKKVFSLFFEKILWFGCIAIDN